MRLTVIRRVCGTSVRTKRQPPPARAATYEWGPVKMEPFDAGSVLNFSCHATVRFDVHTLAECLASFHRPASPFSLSFFL